MYTHIYDIYTHYTYDKYVILNKNLSTILSGYFETSGPRKPLSSPQN